MKARKGASIVLILIMVMLLSILGTQVLVTLNSETKANMNKVDNTQAAYVAQAMAESFAVYMKSQTPEGFLKVYKLADKNGLVIYKNGKKNSPLVRVDKKYYTPIEVKAEDLKKIDVSGNLAITENDFKDFKAEGIIKFYDLGEDNESLKGITTDKIDSSQIRKVRARAEGWYNKGTEENPNYVSHGIDMYFTYDVENDKLYGNEPASIIVKDTLFMDKRVKAVETEEDLVSNTNTDIIFRIKHRLGVGQDEKIRKIEENLNLKPNQIKVVNQDNNYYNYKFPVTKPFEDKKKELIDKGLDKVKLGGVKMGRPKIYSIGQVEIDTKNKTIANKIGGYFYSSRGIIWSFKKGWGWNLRKAREISNEESYLNGTLFDGIYYGGSEFLATKPACSINGENKGLTSGVYQKLVSNNNALSSYSFNIENPNNYFTSRCITIDTKENEITEIVLDELDIQAPIFVRGKGLVHFYVKDSVRIGNLSTIFTESFIFTNPIKDDNVDTAIMSNEVVDTLSDPIHFKNNASRATIFYYGTDPVVLSGTIESSVNIVAPYADIILSPTVAQSIAVKNKNMTFKGVLMSGRDIDIYLGRIGGTIGNSFKYRLKGLFYAPYGNITVNAKKPSVIAGTMIAENISLKCPDALAAGYYLGIKTGYEYSYKELSDRGIGVLGNRFFLAFMKDM